jgi:hypothetical protein
LKSDTISDDERKRLKGKGERTKKGIALLCIINGYKGEED